MTTARPSLLLTLVFLICSWMQVAHAAGPEMRRVEFSFRDSAAVPPPIGVFGPNAERYIRPSRTDS